MDIFGLIPSFGGALYTLAAFVVALSVIVAIHEYGHYIVGRWCGIHADVFSLGFGPVLASWRDRRGTRWQIAALPLGGYVRFAGDSDAASGRDAEALDRLSASERRRTMHGAPVWARAATVAAGPVFNFVLSILVFAAVMMAQGEVSAPLTVAQVKPMPAAQDGLRPGDVIQKIDGRDVPAFDEFAEFIDTLPLSDQFEYSVLREGREVSVKGPNAYPPIVSSVSPGSAAMDADLRIGDVIQSVEGKAVVNFEQLRDAVTASNGGPILLTLWRDGLIFDQRLTPRTVDLPLPDGGFEKRYLIGVTGGLFFEPVTAMPGPVAALRAGIDQTVFIVRQSISGLYHMVTGAISSCNLSGPIGIAETSGAAASQGIASFIWFIAVLSTAVGLLNLFPVPVLDGGHLVFCLYEAVVGRPPSEGAMRILMAGGLAIILSLMVFALGNDIFCP